MNIGLIDVDGHNFPNLALMRISSWHKAHGDTVEWWWGFGDYDIVYKSKVFSDAYSTDMPDPINANKIVKGGTGYCIQLENGIEVYHKEYDSKLPAEIEKCFPDYSIYPQYDFAVSKTSEGCPRGCSFCHVQAKEGCKSIKTADVSSFWLPGMQKSISVCDPNILACRDKEDLLMQYRDTGAYIDYNQGLDIRLMTDNDAQIINQTKIKNLHFAWDNPDEDLRERFEMFADRRGKAKTSHGHNGTVFCLTNFGDYTVQEHIDRLLYRVYFLRDNGYKPFVMVYNKPSAPKDFLKVQRWVNNPFVFYSTNKYEDYDGKR